MIGRLLALSLLATVALTGCSSGSEEGSATAAPPTAKDAKAPPDVPGKVVHRMPPLAGPNAGKGESPDK